jgi:hypothetical protein
VPTPVGQPPRRSGAVGKAPVPAAINGVVPEAAGDGAVATVVAAKCSSASKLGNVVTDPPSDQRLTGYVLSRKFCTNVP